MSVTVLFPTGGQTFQGGAPLTVQWSTTDAPAFQAVRLSTDGGLTFTNVAVPDLPGSARSFTFNLPNPAATVQAIVRVAVKDPSGVQFGKGDSAPFTLQPVSTQVVITSPTGGVFQAGQQLTVNWNTTGPVSFHAVRISINGGAFTNVTATDLPGTARSFAFSLPSPPSPSSSAVVKVVAKNAAGAEVASGDSASFSLLSPAAQVTVMFPNGGEAFDPLDASSITWQVAAGAAIAGQDVLLSLDGGTTYAPLATNLPAAARAFAWTVPDSPTQTARVKVVARFATGAQGTDQSDGLFAIKTPTIAGLSPAVLPRGTATTVTLTGTALPANVAKYKVTGPGGAAAPGLVVKSVAGTKTERQLRVEVSPAAPPATYTLTVSAAAAKAFEVASAASVAGGRLVLPPDQELLAVRYGRRHDPASGALQTQVGVLLGKPAAAGTPASSLLLTFVPGLPYAALEIPRRGPDRFTDFKLADLAGTDDHVLVGVSGKSQDDDKADILPAFEVFEPKQGAVAVARTALAFQGTFNAGPNPCVAGAGMPCDPNQKTDVDGAFVAKAAPGSRQEVVAIVPQTSFVACCFANVNTTVFLLTGGAGGSVVSTPIAANHLDGNPLERNMVTFADLAGRRKLVVVSKAVAFTFDVASRTLQNVRQFSDPEDQGRVQNSRDVPDFPTVTSCSPAEDQAGPQCTAQGRRYGQFRVMRIGGIDRIVLAGHSVSGALNPLYTVYGNPLTETTPGRNARFLAPIAGWQGATNVPAGQQYSNAFRTYYRYLTEAKKKRGKKSEETLGKNSFFPLFTFANGGLLLRGTPMSGIDFLAGTAQPSLVASLADADGTTASARFEVLSADNGRTVLSRSGAIAYDLLRPADPAAPVRILAWGVAGKTSYAEGRIEVYVPEGGGLTQRLAIEEEPVLLDLGRVNRPPEGLAISGEAIAVFNACVKSDGRKAFLTSPRGDARRVSAYDVDDLSRRFAAVPLGGTLHAVAEPGELPLAVAAAANGSTLVVQGDDKSLRFVAVASGFQLVPGALANPGGVLARAGAAVAA